VLIETTLGCTWSILWLENLFLAATTTILFGWSKPVRGI
jgi:hypothetical protein